MSSPESDTSSRSDLLDDVLAAYMERLDRGEAVDGAGLLAEYPDLAPELRAYFDASDELGHLASPLATASVGNAVVATPRPEGAGEGCGAPAIGPTFGDYEVLGEIARGGMGVVYKARQKSLNRVVALKMILHDSPDSANGLRRFRTEAETAANLDHPHILPVYEVGEHAGRHFFSMKLLEGGSLAQQGSRFTSDPRAAAQLLAIVARAVHYAHQHGLLHRDLKPTNILLDREGLPYVTDFGLAKRIEGDSDLTQSGLLVGTPCYMAPEQAAGRKDKITTATDVYGLGAILYEVLTGRPPFRADTPLATLLEVKEREPEVPRALNAAVPRDLETICLKCLAKDPRRRYRSAEELAEDLERWLAGDPIQARRHGAGERLMKWTRRRPALAALVLVSSGAGLTMVGGGLWYNAQLRTALQAVQAREQDLRRERDAAEKARDVALGNFRLARSSLMQNHTLLLKTLGAPGHDFAELRRQLLARAIRVYENQILLKSDHPELEAERGGAFVQLARIKADTGPAGGAIELVREAVDLYARLVRDHPESRYRAGLAEAWFELGRLLQQRGGQSQAEHPLRNALEIFQELAGPASSPVQYRDFRARCYYNLALLATQTGKPAQALVDCREAVALLEALVRDNPTYDDGQQHLGAAYTTLGYCYEIAGQPAEARRTYDQALEIYRQRATAYPNAMDCQADLADSHLAIGGLDARLGRRAEARAAFERALTIYEWLAREFPMIWTMRMKLGVTYERLGQVSAAEGKPADAVEWFGRGIVKLEEIRAQDLELVRVLGLLSIMYLERADALTALGRHAEALPDREQALARCQDASERPQLRSLRAATRAYLGDHAAAVAEATEVAGQLGVSGKACYNLVCVYTLSATAVGRDARLSPEERRNRREAYEARAVELLAQVRASGFFKNPAYRDQWRNDPDLNPLRARQDFKQLFSTAEAGTP